MHGLKYKAPVSEREFCEYLKRICGDEYLRRLILGYYKWQKKRDHKFGKGLVASSFVVPMYAALGFDVATDQAKFLFGARVRDVAALKAQGMVLEAINRASGCANVARRGKEVSEGLGQKLVKLRFRQVQNFYDKIDNQPIGYADFFRWQFVNFVDKIEIDKYCGRDVTSRSGYSLAFRTLFVDGLHAEAEDETADAKEFKYWTDASNVFHELTHLMAVQTVQNGKFGFLQKGEIVRHRKRKGVVYYPRWHDEDGRPSQAMMDAYVFGKTIVNEMLTEVYTSNLINKKTLVEFEKRRSEFEHSPKLEVCCVIPKSKMGNAWFASGYHHFAHLVYLPALLVGQSPSEVFCENIDVGPTSVGHKLLEGVFSGADLGEDMHKLVNQKIVERLGVRACDVEGDKQMQNKILVLMGIAWQEFNKTRLKPRQSGADADARNNDVVQLLQAVMLEDFYNKAVRSVGGECEELWAMGEKEEVFLRLAGFTENFELIDNLVLKPNIVLSRRCGQPIWAREKLSNCELLEIKPNLALEKWAKFLEYYVGVCEKYAPVVLRHPVLKKEKAALDKRRVQNQEDLKNCGMARE